ncbi:MAG: hypothetical protein ABJD11_09095 [Gemmatimonadota bacterium]
MAERAGLTYFIRVHRFRLLTRVIASLGFLLLAASKASAQDSVPAPVAVPDSVAALPDSADSLAHPPVRPMGAFFRSLLVPGWGQAKLKRRLTGGIFVAWEGVTLGMALKASHELAFLKRTGSGRVTAKRNERQDWIVLLAFNHLFSGLEAFVSAHLWDFPADLHSEALPGGRMGTGLSIPIRVR